MQKDYTHIAIVRDRSGSMQSIATDMDGALTTYVEEQKKLPGKLTLSLFDFDDKYEPVFEFESGDKAKIKPIVPRGSTALLDAVGRTIKSTGERLASMPDNERPEYVLFVIITDGHENASKEWRRQQVFDAVKHQTDKYNWRFTYLGANQDAIAVAGSIGIRSFDALNYTASSQGVQNMQRGLVGYTSALRSGNSASFDPNS